MKGRVPLAAPVTLLWGDLPSPEPGLKLLKSYWKTFTRAGILGREMGILLHFCSASPGRGDAVSHLLSHPP